MKAMMKNKLTPYEEFINASSYSKEYIKDKYPTEKDYIENYTKFFTYAVLTPNGEWHEPGKMRWWGSRVTPEQERKFKKEYEEKFIKQANPEWKLTIVDCHI